MLLPVFETNNKLLSSLKTRERDIASQCKRVNLEMTGETRGLKALLSQLCISIVALELLVVVTSFHYLSLPLQESSSSFSHSLETGEDESS